MNIPNPLSHAYLITGGSAATRAALARQMAAAYLCEGAHSPCGSCRSCRKVAAAIHPDVSLTTLLPDKREILVEQARTIRTDAYIRPNEGSRKVYIVDPADSMNENAQNTLLKVLEEGPSYAAFLLLAQQPGRLLETVRSRCEHLSLPPEEEERDPARLEQCRELARMVMTAGEPELAEYFVGLEQEKMKSAQLMDLLAGTEEMLSPWLLREPRRAVKALNAIRRVRENAHLHPGVGLTLGWICAELFR